MKTLIIGGSGKIGSYLINKKNSIIHTYHKNRVKNGIKFDIIKDDISNIIIKHNISSVVFLGAISDPNICFKNKKYTKKLNIEKTIKILDFLIKKNIYFIFFSSEFIFSGNKGNYDEKNIARPNNEYGKQKLKVEKYIKKNAKKFAVFRIAKTYGENLNEDSIISNYLRDLLEKKREFNVAYDQKFNPMFVKDLKKIVFLFLKKKFQGTYNVGGNEKLTRFDCLKKINFFLKKKIKNTISLNKKELKIFNYHDKRPLNVTFNTKKINNKLNFKMTKFDTIAKKMIKKYKINEKIFN